MVICYVSVRMSDFQWEYQIFISRLVKSIGYKADSCIYSPDMKNLSIIESGSKEFFK